MIQVVAYKCEFCDKVMRSKTKMEKHEKKCVKRPNESKKVNLPEREFFKRLPHRFYSPKFKSWIERSSVYKDGNWYQYDLINENTREVVEISCSERSVIHLNKRTKDLINSERVFGSNTHPQLR